MTVKKKQAIHRHTGKRIVTPLEAAKRSVCDTGTRDGSTPWGKRKRRQEQIKPKLGEAMQE